MNGRGLTKDNARTLFPNNKLERLYLLYAETVLELRQYIEFAMEEMYGVGWFIAAPVAMKYKPYRKHFDSFDYHELISMIQPYSCFEDIPGDVYSQMLKTVPTRNKIAHYKIVIEAEKVTIED
ncbi:hypothetical protein [Lentibacillus amyloliquefaciens]|uniref:Uncharacterized protein n=1 Tax=Lentibacillus amyloliquefaciens TaxID=1472767 RepID=A0A0U4F2L1_9BACI|nr:hypothetical protein [Lentibacillus amyloliquefaciens]ALX47814.1 hypothetical protein AOX59_03885 [Lentibacillus amyloliquefaciens]